MYDDVIDLGGMAVGGISSKVLVADNHSVSRAGLAAIFVSDVGVSGVVEASNFSEMLAHITREPGIRLVTVDLALPGLNGPATLRQLRIAHPDLLVVVVAAALDRAMVLEALAAGVHGCVPMNLTVPALAAAFLRVFAGQIYVPPQLCDVAPPRHLSIRAGEQRHDGLLTGRQQEVVRLIAAGRSNKEIARMLGIAEGTVKVHVTAAFRILGVHNRVGAAFALNDIVISSRSEAAVRGLSAHDGRRHAPERRATFALDRHVPAGAGAHVGQYNIAVPTFTSPI